MADNNSIPIGLCQCGCGGVTQIAGWTSTKRGNVAGQPQRYVLGHSSRRGKRDPMKTPYGKVGNGSRHAKSWPDRVHQVRAERALGRPLPKGAQVHHLDGSTSDDAPLVICPDQKYHSLLHARARVIQAGGNPNTERVCSGCKRPKPMAEFGKSHRCSQCSRDYSIETTRRRRLRTGRRRYGRAIGD